MHVLRSSLSISVLHWSSHEILHFHYHFLSDLETIIWNWEWLWSLSARTSEIKAKFTDHNPGEELFCRCNLRKFIECEFWETSGTRRPLQNCAFWSMKSALL
jgi:hypothetical protein